MERLIDENVRIVVVDDKKSSVVHLQRVLEKAGYTGVVTTTDSSEAVALCTKERTDLLVLDLQMPAPDGYEVMSMLSSRDETFPILVLTADDTPETKLRVLAGGARDFLTKPFDHVEVLLRIENLLEMHVLQQELRHQNENLEREVSLRTRELELAQHETLDRLARVAEYRDDDTGQHVSRVGWTCELIAAALGLPPQEAELIHRAATLHDVGKVGVPDRVLLKPGRLTAEEFEEMKLHVTLSERILVSSHSRLLQLAEQIASSHHERWDGSGYPRGLEGEHIPLVGRIVAVADVFDALTHARPYKEAWSTEAAVAEIRAQSGRHFDPRVVEAFDLLDHQALLGSLGPGTPPRGG